MTIKKNDRLIIDITGTTSEGYGVGKSDRVLQFLYLIQQ